MVAHVCNASYLGGNQQKSKSAPEKKFSSVAEHYLNMHKTLGCIPSTTVKKKVMLLRNGFTIFNLYLPFYGARDSTQSFTYFGQMLYL
jgi:hypothetical protein